MGFNNKLQLKGEIFLPCKDYALNESINCPACNMIVIICIPVDQNSIKKSLLAWHLSVKPAWIEI